MEIDADEVQQLKALVAEQQERLDALERHVDAPNSGETVDKRSTRRQLLKLAGATLAGAAGSAALRAIPAAAADGDTVTVGNGFTETLGTPTFVNATGVSGGSLSGVLDGFANTGIGVWGYAKAGQGVHANSFGGGTGIVAIGNGSGAGTGVSAFGNGIGVIGNGGYFGVSAYGSLAGVTASSANEGVSGNGNPGVFGVSASGIGVQALSAANYSRAMYGYTSGTGATGIETRSINGFGGAIRGAVGLLVRGDNGGGTYTYAFGAGSAALLARSLGGGPDAVLDGTGRLVQYNGVAGAPYGAPNFSPAPSLFESMRAADGTLWISGALTTGTSKSRWRRVNAVRVDSADGTGVPFTPFRLVDTRTGTKPAKNSTITYVVAGAGSGTSTIPTDAIAVVGNLTATQYSGAGFLTISPAGVTVTTSSVNFITGQGSIANSFIVGLGTGANLGKVQVQVSDNTASHYLIDITGYIQ